VDSDILPNWQNLTSTFTDRHYCARTGSFFPVPNSGVGSETEGILSCADNAQSSSASLSGIRMVRTGSEEKTMSTILSFPARL
jgi:hypothetical protein